MKRYLNAFELSILNITTPAANRFCTDPEDVLAVSIKDNSGLAPNGMYLCEGYPVCFVDQEVKETQNIEMFVLETVNKDNPTKINRIVTRRVWIWA